MGPLGLDSSEVRASAWSNVELDNIDIEFEEHVRTRPPITFPSITTEF